MIHLMLDYETEFLNVNFVFLVYLTVFYRSLFQRDCECNINANVLGGIMLKKWVTQF